jgi:hypothetical protein
MLFIGMLFALLTVGFVMPCLIDALRTPPFAIRSLSKQTWVLLILLLSVIGAAAWLIAGRPDGRWHVPVMPHLDGLQGIRQQEALRRHPAGRHGGLGLEEVLAGQDGRRGLLRPLGPDDDIDFLRELDRRIRGDREADNDS